MSYLIFLLIFLFNIVNAQCYKSTIVSPVPFKGNHGEVFKLADGSIWKVIYEYEYLYEHRPDIIVCPSQNIIIINGKKLNVINLGNRRSSSHSPDIIESQIDGDFKGWEGETIYKLTNGQIWQQASYYYYYAYKFMPNIIIYRENGRYFIHVKGTDCSVEVKRLL